MPESRSERLWIFANGILPDCDLLKNLFWFNDRFIAADGGQAYLAKLGIQPERVIGDLDSIPETEIKRLEQLGVILDRYPVDKDETDLELAIRWAVHEGFVTIRIAGALGGRLDQTLGNITLLTQTILVGKDIRLEDGLEEVFLIRDRMVIEGAEGDTVSLIPVFEVAEGVTTSQLKYPLVDENLYLDRTRGISNVMSGERAEVSVRNGTLLCVHRRKIKGVVL